MDISKVSLEKIIDNDLSIKEEVKKIEDKKINDPKILFSKLSDWGTDWIFEKPKKRLAVLRDMNGNLVIPQGKVGLLIAAGGTGKSQLIMQLITALVTGTRFLNRFINGESRGNIAYISGEEDKNEIQTRFQNICEQLNLNSEERFKLLSKVYVHPLCTVNANFSETSPSYENILYNLLLENAGKDGWSLIVFDPASRFLPKDAEIDNAAATKFITECEKFTKLPGSPAVLISHHVNKTSIGGAKLFSEEFDSNQSASRGASAFVDGARFVINIDTIQNEDWIQSTEYSNKKLLKIRHSKMNYGPFMSPINAVIDDKNGVIYSLDPDTEEDLKITRSRYKSSKPSSNIRKFENYKSYSKEHDIF